jgi:hypothetical protein
MPKNLSTIPHETNSRTQPGLLAMRGKYKSEGYGWYWILSEMLRNQPGFKLPLREQFVWNAIVLETQCERIKIESFIRDCIDEFKLFISDGEYFWSNDLLTQAKINAEKSEKARYAAFMRWHSECNEEEMQTHADGMQTHTTGMHPHSERKKASVKPKNSPQKPQTGSLFDLNNIDLININTNTSNKKDPPAKKHYAEFVTLTEEEHQKLVTQFGPDGARERIEDLNLWKGAKGKKTASDYLTILNWARREVKEHGKAPATTKPNPRTPRNEFSSIDFSKFEYHGSP